MSESTKKSSVNYSALLVFLLLLIPLSMNIYWTVYVFGQIYIWVGILYVVVNLSVLVKLINMFFKGNSDHPNRVWNSVFVVMCLVAFGFEVWGSFQLVLAVLGFFPDGGSVSFPKIPSILILELLFVTSPLLLTIWHSYLQSSFYNKDK